MFGKSAKKIHCGKGIIIFSKAWDTQKFICKGMNSNPYSLYSVILHRNGRLIRDIPVYNLENIMLDKEARHRRLQIPSPLT